MHSVAYLNTWALHTQNLIFTQCMVQSISSAQPRNLLLLWKINVNHHYNKNPILNPSHFNPVHIIKIHFSKINFNILLLHTPSLMFPSKFITKILYILLVFSTHALSVLFFLTQTLGQYWVSAETVKLLIV